MIFHGLERMIVSMLVVHKLTTVVALPLQPLYKVSHQMYQTADTESLDSPSFYLGIDERQVAIGEYEGNPSYEDDEEEFADDQAGDPDVDLVDYVDSMESILNQEF